MRLFLCCDLLLLCVTPCRSSCRTVWHIVVTLAAALMHFVAVCVLIGPFWLHCILSTTGVICFLLGYIQQYQYCYHTGVYTWVIHLCALLFHSVNNQSAILLEKNGKLSSSSRTKHINVRYFFIKDCVDRKEVKIEFCGTDKMWADFYTKPLQGRKFIEFRKIILNLKE